MCCRVVGDVNVVDHGHSNWWVVSALVIQVSEHALGRKRGASPLDLPTDPAGPILC